MMPCFDFAFSILFNGSGTRHCCHYKPANRMICIFTSLAYGVLCSDWIWPDFEIRFSLRFNLNQRGISSDVTWLDKRGTAWMLPLRPFCRSYWPKTYIHLSDLPDVANLPQNLVPFAACSGDWHAHLLLNASDNVGSQWWAAVVRPPPLPSTGAYAENC